MGKQTKKRVKKISVSEFKMWLAGIEELQGSDWHPTKEQWVTIRERIEAIEDMPKKDIEELVKKLIETHYPVSKHRQVGPPPPAVSQPRRQRVPQVPPSGTSLDGAQPVGSSLDSETLSTPANPFGLPTPGETEVVKK